MAGNGNTAKYFVDLFDTPRLLFEGFEVEGNRATFALLSREDYRKYHYHRVRLLREDGAQPQVFTVALDGLIEMARGRKPGRLNYIFNIPYSNISIFMAVIGQLEECVRIYEPKCYEDLAFLSQDRKMKRVTEKQFGDIRNLVTVLSARTFSPKQTSIVKLPEIAEPLLDGLLESQSNSKAIFVYSDFRRYFAHTHWRADWPEANRVRLRALLKSFPDIVPDSMKNEDFSAMSEGPAFAALWFFLMNNYLRVSKALGDERVKSIHCEDYLRAPVKTLRTFGQILNLGLDDKEVDGMMEFEPMKNFIKVRNYDPAAVAAREEETTRLVEANAAEYKKGLEWLKKATENFPIPAKLPGNIELPK